MRKLHISRNGSLSIDTSMNRDMLSDSLRQVAEDPPLLMRGEEKDPLSLSLRSEMSATSHGRSRLSSRLLYTQKKLRDLEEQFGMGSRGYKSSPRNMKGNVTSSSKKMPPPPPRIFTGKRLAFEEEADSLDEIRGQDSLDEEDESGWKKQFENSTGSSASAWALLAGSRVRHNETKRSDGSGSVTGQIIRKLHAELADRDRALSYARSETAEANRRADIEKRRADASEKVGRRLENRIRQEQQSLALTKQELSHQKDQDILRTSIQREHQNLEIQQLRDEVADSRDRVCVEEQSMKLEADFCTSWQRECREERESLRRMRNANETLESTMEAEAELCTSLTSRTMRADEALEKLRVELRDLDSIERGHLRKVDRLEEKLQERESFDVLRRSTRDKSFEMKEKEFRDEIEQLEHRAMKSRKELQEAKELQRVLKTRYEREIEIARDEAEKTGATFARDEVLRRTATHEHAMEGLRNANALRVEEHERALHDVREEHERAVRELNSRNRKELKSLKEKENQEMMILEKLQRENKSQVLEYENEIVRASNLKVSEEAWMELARNAEEAQIRISNEATESLRQQQESYRKELESEKRFAKSASMDVQRLIDEQTDAMSSRDTMITGLQDEIAMLRHESKTVSMLESRIANVNEDQMYMEKQIEEVESKYRNELSTIQSETESSSREQIGRMARAEHQAIAQLHCEIEAGTKQTEISTEEISSMHKTLGMIRSEESETIRQIETEAAKMIKTSEDRAVKMFEARHEHNLNEEWEKQESQIRLKLRRVRWDMQAMRLELDTEIEQAQAGREAEEEKCRLERLVREHEASSHLALLEIEDRVMEQQASMVSRMCEEENAYREQLSDAEEHIASSFVRKHREMSNAKRSRVETELDDLRRELENARSELDVKSDESKSLREALERSNESMRKCEEKVASSDVLKRKLNDVTQMMDGLQSDRRRVSVQRLYVASNQLNKSRLAWAMNRWRVSVFSSQASSGMVKRYQHRLKRQNRAMEQMRKRFEHETSRMESHIERLYRDLSMKKKGNDDDDEEEEEDVTISILDLNTLKEEEEENEVPQWRTPPKVKEEKKIPEWKYNDDGNTIREKTSSQRRKKEKKMKKKKKKKGSDVDNFWSEDIPPFPDKSTRRRADHQHWKETSSHRRGTYFGTFAANKNAPVSKDQWRRGALRALKKAISKRRTLYGRRLDPSKLQDVFSLLDRSHDGHVDETELKLALKRLDIYLSEKQEHKLFRAIDRNADGLIQLSEFRYLMITAVST